MKTKIIATYGPAIERGPVLAKLMKHVDIFRINFSFGSEEEWLDAAENINRVAKSSGREVSLLADLPGPKIRLGVLNGQIDVKKGEMVTFRYGKSTDGVVPLDHNIYPYLSSRSIISMGDGNLNFGVMKLQKGEIVCRVLNFIGMSFVRSAKNVSDMRRRAGDAFIVAKIERAEAVKRIDEISEEADAIMVARGDLAFEIPVEMLPIVQARIIRSSMKFYKPVIVATQMLLSMVNSPMPTRSEVNDVATAVLSGVDCVMLSEETAVGKYPVEAARTMATTARNAEGIATHHQHFKIRDISDSVVFAAAEIADNYRTDCIFAPTQTGRTAQRLSALRSRSDIIALNRFPWLRKRLNIYYGVRSEPIERFYTIDGMFNHVRSIANRKGIRRYIVVSGSPNQAGSTNTLKYIE